MFSASFPSKHPTTISMNDFDVALSNSKRKKINRLNFISTSKQTNKHTNKQKTNEQIEIRTHKQITKQKALKYTQEKIDKHQQCIQPNIEKQVRKQTLKSIHTNRKRNRNTKG
jgi:hypothetical protein